MRFQIVCFLMLLFVMKGNGLQCYVCTTALDEDCGGSTPADRHLQTCSEGEGYCQRVQLGDLISRACFATPLNVGPVCVGGICSSTASCQTDGCNHSNGKYVINHMFAIVGMVLALILCR